MEIFKNPNYDFLRWRWHALFLSWAIIVAGAITFFTAGLPLSVEFSGGTIVIVEFDKMPEVDQVRSALDRAGVRRWRPERRRPAVRSRVGTPRHGAAGRGRRRAGHGPEQDGGPGARRARQGESRQLQAGRHANRRADRRQGADAQGVLGDRALARRHPGLHRISIPLLVRGRSRGRHDPRHPHHAVVHPVLPLRHVAQRDRGVPRPSPGTRPTTRS